MLRFIRRKEKTLQGLERSRSAWFGRLAGLLQRSQPREGAWEEVEEALIGADVGVASSAALVQRARERVRSEIAGRGAVEALKEEMRVVLRRADADEGHSDQPESPPKPLVVLVVGVNGVGKTTSIAKLTALHQAEGRRVILAAGDTFRAAAIEQLQAWAERLGCEVVTHRQGADPAAVAFDALEAAHARGADVLIVDTAGRLHTRSNLMEEMKKIRRVLSRMDPEAPHEVLLVLDATTGQNGLAQAQGFVEAVGCTGIFLAKLDGSAKGGVVLAIADQLRLPVRFIGTGEGLEDATPFDPEEYLDALFATKPLESPH